MSIESLMPTKKNNRRVYRDYIHNLINIMEQNGYTTSGESLLEVREKTLSELLTKNENENVYNIIPFGHKMSDYTWLLLVDDDLSFVRIYSTISISSLGLNREHLLNLANDLNLKKNTLLDVAIDGDGDVVCEYHLPIKVSEEVVLSVLKEMMGEVVFIMRFIVSSEQA